MPTNFNQTVNLRKKDSSREKREENFYDSYEEEKQDLKKISKPQVKQVNEGFAKRMTVIAAIVFICVIFYFMFFNNKEQGKDLAQTVGWYSVELVNGEVYYGQISDLSTNPIVISNVYYNYDQIKNDEKEMDETGNIRLVKRGKETHGPSGTMYIYQIQLGKPIDELRQDSLVLQEILKYEK